MSIPMQNSEIHSSLITIFDKLSKPTTREVAYELYKKLVLKNIYYNPQSNFIIQQLNDFISPLEPKEKEPTLKLLSLFFSQDNSPNEYEEKQIYYPYLSPILSILQSLMKEQNNCIFSSIANCYAEIVQNLMPTNIESSNIELENDEKKIFEMLQGFCIYNMKCDDKSNKILGSLCLTKLVENCPIVLQPQYLKYIWENIISFIDKKNFNAKYELLNCLISLILGAENLFSQYANVTLYKVLDFLTDTDWLKRKLALNVIYTLIFYCKEEIVPLKEHIINFLKVLKTDKVKEVREVCLLILQSFNEYDTDNNIIYSNNNNNNNKSKKNNNENNNSQNKSKSKQLSKKNTNDNNQRNKNTNSIKATSNRSYDNNPMKNNYQQNEMMDNHYIEYDQNFNTNPNNFSTSNFSNSNSYTNTSKSTQIKNKGKNTGIKKRGSSQTPSNKIINNPEIMIYEPKNKKNNNNNFNNINNYDNNNDNNNNSNLNTSNIEVENKRSRTPNRNYRRKNLMNENVKFINRREDNTFVNEKMVIKRDPNKSIFKQNPNQDFFKNAKNNNQDVIILAKSPPPNFIHENNENEENKENINNEENENIDNNNNYEDDNNEFDENMKNIINKRTEEIHGKNDYPIQNNEQFDDIDIVNDYEENNKINERNIDNNIDEEEIQNYSKQSNKYINNYTYENENSDNEIKGNYDNNLTNKYSKSESKELKNECLNNFEKKK